MSPELWGRLDVHRGVRVWVAVLVLGWAGNARADEACLEVDCSGHGVCVPEDGRAYCLCDSGFVAEELRCVAQAPQPTPKVAGEQIVAVAREQVGRELPTIGLEQLEYPGALRDHLPVDELWCTDFVAWVYRVAGVPLGGGYEGGWLVTNNRALRIYFERRGLWVGKRDPGFATFEPEPGDYVRIRTRTWGHSAIVERVEGSTLHIIEGNARGVVRATAYRNFRTHPKVDGFGIVTRPKHRRVWRAPILEHWRRARHR